MGESKRLWGASNRGVGCLTEEYQVLGGWKVASDWGSSFTKIGLVGVIERSGSKLDSIMLHLDPYPFAHVLVDKGPTVVGLDHAHSYSKTFLLIFNERCSLMSNLIFTSVFGTMVINNGHKHWCDVITSNISPDDVILIL